MNILQTKSFTSGFSITVGSVGNGLILALASSTSGTLTNVTDNKGNVWSKVVGTGYTVGNPTPVGYIGDIWYCANVVASGLTTISFTGTLITGSNSPRGYAIEVQGGIAAGASGTSHGTGRCSVTATGPSISSSDPSALYVGIETQPYFVGSPTNTNGFSNAFTLAVAGWTLLPFLSSHIGPVAYKLNATGAQQPVFAFTVATCTDGGPGATNKNAVAAAVFTSVPTFGVTPTSLSFSKTNCSNPVAQTLTVTGTDSWTAVSDSSWLSITPTSGTGGTASVSVDPTNLATGVHTGNVTFTDVTNAGTQVIPVTFTISGGAKIPVTGTFQDALGNPLNGGTIVLKLNADATNACNKQICAGVVSKTTLDSLGRVQNTSAYPNASLTTQYPSGVQNTYSISIYSAAGQCVWQQSAVVIVDNTSGSGFDLNQYTDSGTE